MSKIVHVTADRVRNGMRRLEKLAESDEAFQAERKALQEAERRLRDDWDRDRGKGA